MYGNETWSHTMQEELMIENKMLKRIFGTLTHEET